MYMINPPSPRPAPAPFFAPVTIDCRTRRERIRDALQAFGRQLIANAEVIAFGSVCFGCWMYVLIDHFSRLA